MVWKSEQTGRKAFPARMWVVILWAAVGVSFFTGLGGAPLFDKDEGAFCEATREMIASGNYLMPFMNGEPRYDKPILIYWLQAASVKVFGLNEFALRFPSAVAAAFWAWVVYRFARRMLGAEKAFLATFFLVTALQVTIIAQAAIADAVLNLFIAASMFSFYRFLESDERKFYYAGVAAAAFGMLTKGPVAILVPLATTFLYCWSRKDLRRWARTLIDPRGIGLFLLIAMPWYVAAIADQGWPILNAWIFKQTVGRLHHPLEGHGGGLFYYIPVLIAGVMPYTTILFRTLGQARADFKAPLTRFCLIWFAFVFVFFSFSGTKLPHYLIYGYTPLFLLMAIHVDRVKSDFLLMLPALLLLAVLIWLPYLAPLLKVKDEFARIVIQESAHAFDRAYLFPLFIGFAILFAMALIRSVPRKVRLVALGFIMAGLLNLHIMPFAAGILQAPIKKAAIIARENDYDVILWKINMPSFIFYRQKPIEKRLPFSGDIVLTQINLLRKLAEHEILYERNGYALARVGTILSYEGKEKDE